MVPLRKKIDEGGRERGREGERGGGKMKEEGRREREGVHNILTGYNF